MKAFVYGCDGYLQRPIAEALNSLNYDVSGAFTTSSDASPGCLSNHFQTVPGSVDPAVLRECASCHVGVFYLPGNEALVTRAMQEMSGPLTDAGVGEGEGPTPRVLIALTSPATWSLTAEVPSAPPHVTKDGTLRGTGVLSERDEAVRQGHPGAYVTLEAERTLVRAGRQQRQESSGAGGGSNGGGGGGGGLLTYVVCAGHAYGRGESFFRRMFMAALMAGEDPSRGVPRFGEGHNILPTIHLDDLASYVATLAARPPEDLSYLVAVDDGFSTLTDICQAIAQSDIGAGHIHNVPPEEMLMAEEAHAMLAHVPFQHATPLPESDRPMTWKHKAGMVAGITAAVADFVAAQDIRAVRVLVAGQTLESQLAVAEQLSQVYGVPVVSIKTHLDTSKLDEAMEALNNPPKKAKVSDLQAAVDAARTELQGELVATGRRLLREKACRLKGYVLVGYPETAQEAETLFSDPTPEPLIDLSPDGAEERPPGEPPVADGSSQSPWGRTPLADIMVTHAVSLDGELQEEEALAEALARPESALSPPRTPKGSSGGTKDAKPGAKDAKGAKTPSTPPGPPPRTAYFYLTKNKDVQALSFKIPEPPPLAPPAAATGDGKPSTPAKGAKDAKPAKKSAQELEAEAAEAAARAREHLARHLGEIAASVVDAIGPTFFMRPAVVEAEAERVVDEAELQAREAAEAARAAAAEDERQERLLMEEMTAHRARVEAEEVRMRAEPYKQLLVSAVMPAVTKGLLELCKLRPQQPILFLAEFLAKEADELDAAEQMLLDAAIAKREATVARYRVRM
eukprot:jgi/Mesvir1/17455/Mv08729-RA.1